MMAEQRKEEKKNMQLQLVFSKYFYGVWSGLPELETFLYTSALAKSGRGGGGRRDGEEGMAEASRL